MPPELENRRRIVTDKLQRKLWEKNRREDFELAEKAKEGDNDALGKLWAKYEKRLLRVTTGIVGNEQTAEETVQDAFIRISKNLSKFRGDSSFYTWAYRIVTNMAIDKRRKFGREVVGKEDDINIKPSPAQLKMTKEIEDSPEHLLIMKEDRDTLERAIDQLSEKRQELVRLYYLEGIEGTKIAKLLDMPLGSVQSGLYYARKELKDILKKIAA